MRQCGLVGTYQFSGVRYCLCLKNQIEYVKGVLRSSRQFARKVASEAKLEVLAKYGLDHVFQSKENDGLHSKMDSLKRIIFVLMIKYLRVLYNRTVTVLTAFMLSL